METTATITRKQIKIKAEEIRRWFDTQCDFTRPDHRIALKRAAIMIWHRQTWDEQERNDTLYNNGRGI
jgi:hypothetical protein